jgi:hypothetical protein
MKTTLVAVAAFAIAGAASFAQMPSGSPGKVNAAMTRLFGKDAAFTAKADVQVLDASRNEWMRAPMQFAVLDDKVRVEINMADMKSKELQEEAAAGLKQLGMDRVISIVRPDKKMTYIIYPGAKSYLSMPMDKEEVATSERDLKVDVVPQGKEKIGNYQTVKNKVTVKDGDAVVLEALTWNATELKDFPVQVETKEKENISVMRFSDIKIGKPDAKQFEPPTDFKGYSSAQQMMMDMAGRMFGPGVDR